MQFVGHNSINLLTHISRFEIYTIEPFSHKLVPLNYILVILYLLLVIINLLLLKPIVY